MITTSDIKDQRNLIIKREVQELNFEIENLLVYQRGYVYWRKYRDTILTIEQVDEIIEKYIKQGFTIKVAKCKGPLDRISAPHGARRIKMKK